MPGPDADLALLTDAAEAAGDIARHYFKKSPEVWDKADDAGPVTEADLAIDRMLRAELLASRPDYGWLSEETEDSAARQDNERVFIVDPIDGTRAFIDGHSAFAHSLAVVERGRPVAAVVFLPIQKKLFVASLGGGAWLNGDALVASDPGPARRADILTTRPNLDPRHWPGGVPDIERKYRPSLAYRMALVGTGRFDGMITFRATWEWDIAAGTLIASEAGARVTDADGQDVSLNNPVPQVNGILAAGPNLHARLMAARGRTA